MYMKKILFGLALLSCTTSVFADYAYGLTVKRLYVQNNGHVSFGTEPQADGTCNYYQFHFDFDSTTEAGKSMLSLLLSAKVSGAIIQVWYTPSTVPGEDFHNGCTIPAMAKVTHLGLE